MRMALPTVSSLEEEVQKMGLPATALHDLGGDSGSSSSGEEEGRPRQKEESRRILRRALKSVRSRLRRYLESVMAGKTTKTFLEYVSIGVEATEEYRKAVNLFLDWAKKHNVVLGVAAEVDAGLVDFMNSEYLRGRPSWEGEKLLAGIMYTYPVYSKNGRAKLPRAWRSLKGWKRMVPGRTRDPHSLGLWKAVAADLVQRSRRPMAVCAMMSLSGYLRPSEGLLLQRKSLIPPAAGVTRFWSLLLFPEEELMRSKVQGADDSILLDSPYVR